MTAPRQTTFVSFSSIPSVIFSPQTAVIFFVCWPLYISAHSIPCRVGTPIRVGSWQFFAFFPRFSYFTFRRTFSKFIFNLITFQQAVVCCFLFLFFHVFLSFFMFSFQKAFISFFIIFYFFPFRRRSPTTKKRGTRKSSTSPEIAMTAGRRGARVAAPLSTSTPSCCTRTRWWTRG